jgi:hypothetical protein
MSDNTKRSLRVVKISLVCSSLLSATFFIGGIICLRIVAALLWEGYSPDLYTDILCLVGIATWMVFVIVGWVRHYSTEAFRWRLILATVLTVMDNVLFWLGYDSVSLIFAASIFFLLTFYFVIKFEEDISGLD